MTSLILTPPLPLLYLLMVSGVVDSQLGLNVYYTPSYICAPKGSTVIMGCSYSYPTINTIQKVFWSRELFKDKEPPALSSDPQYRGRVQYLRDTKSSCSLRLRDVTEQDQGQYYFTLITTAGQKYQGRNGVELSVTELQLEMIPLGVIAGNAVTLTCKTSNRQPRGNLTFIWYKNGSRLPSSTYNTVCLPSVSQKNAGEYRCALQSLLSCAVTLDVQYPPKTASLSVSPSGEIVEGSSVTLTCSSDANPPVEYNWFKGKLFKIKGKTYTINKISSEDSGEYKCKATNQHGEKYSDKVTLNVLYPPKNVSVSVSPSGEMVEGSSVTLTCSSDANPPVQSYTWYKVNESSPVGSRQSYSFMLNSSSSGWFYCVAQNKYGTRSSAAVPLTLNGGKRVVLYVVLGVAVGCGCLVVFIVGVVCMRKRRRGGSADDGRSSQNVSCSPSDDTYMALDLQTRSSNDVYHTLATVHQSPPDDTYTALDSPSISADYYNLPVRRGQF